MDTNKKNIAIVWGGYSSEIIVSEKSMAGIYSFIDKSKYNVYKIRIDRSSWTVELDGRIAGIDKNDFSFMDGNRHIKIDFAYITIHGTPGEDGKLQGYFDMIGIPYSACGMAAASLTMNKFFCNNFLRSFGVNIAGSYIIKQGDVYDIDEIAEALGFPVFVKPNTGGSSFATNKVKSIEGLQKAITMAFGETDEVIVESFIEGTEVTCGCYKTGHKITALPLTEVVTDNEFFDFDAKYNGQVDEITPARISSQLTVTIQQLTVRLYGLIGAKGFIRVDYIIKDNTPYLLEINTTPGMTLTSFIPQQIAAAGLNITDVFTDLIENELNKYTFEP